MAIVQFVLGVGLIGWGLTMQILSVLVWWGKKTPETYRSADKWDVILEIVKKTPWVSTIGLILICLGMKAIGVDLPGGL